MAQSNEAATTTTGTHTLSHTEVLDCKASDAWTVFREGYKVLPDLEPQHFASIEYENGFGNPGSICVYQFGPAHPAAGRRAKEHIDEVDHASKRIAYTMVEGDPSYSFFSAVIQFVDVDEDKTEATWTAKYESVGEAGPPEHIKDAVIFMFKTIERASKFKRTITHTMKIDAPIDPVWAGILDEANLLPRLIPHIIAGIDYVEGHGESGSIRYLRLGSAIPGGKQVLERIDVSDSDAKVLAYTVLEGDPKYKHLSAVMQFTPGPEEGTTIGTWTGSYVPRNEDIPPPALVFPVWKAIEGYIKSEANQH